MDSHVNCRSNAAVQCIFEQLGWYRDVALESAWRESLDGTPWLGKRVYQGCWWLKSTLMVYRPKLSGNTPPRANLVPLPSRPTAEFAAAYDAVVRPRCDQL